MSSQLSSDCNEINKNDITCIGFNQNYSCFSIGTSVGFIVYNIDPLQKRFHCRTNVPVQIVSTLYKTNMVLVVLEPGYKLIIWDDFRNEIVGELEFKSKIVTVNQTRTVIVIAFSNILYIYNSQDLNLIAKYPTKNLKENALSTHYHANEHNKNTVSQIAFETNNTGEVMLVKIEHNIVTENGEKKINITKSQKLIKSAHVDQIQTLNFSQNGNYLATSSVRGTLIRIWNTTLTLHREFRRGHDISQIHSISFDDKDNNLLLTSSKGTLHIYSLNNDTNKKSMFTFFSNVLPNYFSSTWSKQKIEPIDNSLYNSIACFNEKSIFVVTMKGKIFKFVENGDDILPEICNDITKDIHELSKLPTNF